EDMLSRERVAPAAGRRLHGKLVDIRAGDECFLASAGQNNGTHALVLLQVENGPPQLVDGLAVQGIEDARSIDGHDRDMTIALDQQVVESHHGAYSGNGYINQPRTIAAS